MRRKRALLIGINQYHPAIGSLGGCVNDVSRIKKLLLEIYSFPVQEVRELLDMDATRETILDGLEWLIRDAEVGDVLVLYYSGHGTRLANPLDPSGKDEALVAFSPRWEALFSVEPDISVLFRRENWEIQFIRDKEIKLQLDDLLEGVNLTLVMDCCYSGDVNRDVRNYPRYLEPPMSIQTAIQEAQQIYWQSLQESPPEPSLNELKLGQEQIKHMFQKAFLGNRFDFVSTQEKNILLAACSEKETALEKVINGQRGGVFTHHLVEVLSRQDQEWTYAELIQALGDKMRFTLQMPRLTCSESHFQLPVFSSLIN